MKLLSLTPSFSSTQDGPTFSLHLQNDTSKSVDLRDLLASSSIILDGKSYPNRVVKFVGNANLEPGQTHTLLISPDTYLPTGERQGYSPTLKRWRWKTSLPSGKHILTVRIGNTQIGPIEFAWDGDTPLLYK